jgi:hypothetical protein
MREGKTEIVFFSPDFAAEFGDAAMLQQKVNGMYSAERRRLFFASIEDGGTTMSAHVLLQQSSRHRSRVNNG